MQAFDRSFGRFLDAWNRHHTMKTTGASIAELAASRAQLDRLRLEMAIRRHSI